MFNSLLLGSMAVDMAEGLSRRWMVRDSYDVELTVEDSVYQYINNTASFHF
jgi:hypothetical protein